MLPFFEAGVWPVPSPREHGQLFPELAIRIVESLHCDLESVNEVVFRAGVHEGSNQNFHLQSLARIAGQDWRL